LILIEENKSNAKNISYCDDGLLHGESSSEIGEILQELFDTNEVGVKIHPGKSG
jgi:hypothetical protein